jgi:hypothetical protein
MSELYGTLTDEPSRGLYPVKPPKISETSQKLPGQNAVLLNVSGAGQLAIIGDFNFFLLDEVDRELLAQIDGAVRTHKEKKPPEPPEPPKPAPHPDYNRYAEPAKGECIVCGKPGMYNSLRYAIYCNRHSWDLKAVPKHTRKWCSVSDCENPSSTEVEGLPLCSTHAELIDIRQHQADPTEPNPPEVTQDA